MAENILNTRIRLKYDSLSNWSTKNPTLLEGELAIVYLGNSHTTTTPDNGTHPILFKVGPGAFNSLPFASALAADVYTWAKQENLPIVRNDGKNADGSDKAAGNVISGISWNTEGKIEYTTASVATSEGMAELQGAVDAIEKDIEDNRSLWEKDTTYTFAQTADGKGFTITPSEGDAKTISFAFLTRDEIDAILASYYTKSEIDALVKDKLHTKSEIEGYIDAALAAVSGTDTIEGITTLVEYVNTHGTDLAAITKEIYGDSGKVGDDPSRIDTAIANAASAVETANGASGVANAASAVAGEAKELAQNAMNAASDAQTGAAASAQAAAASAVEASGYATTAGEKAAAAAGSAEAAAGSAEAAAASAGVAEGHASTASTKAGEAAASAQTASEAKNAALTAQGKAEEARDAALQAKADAESAKNAAAASESNADNSAKAAAAAQSKAEEAQGKAEDAQGAAKTAQSKAEEAQAAAEAAKAAAEASNTSATAIANAAKAEAEAATAASNAATEAVAGLHKIATSGDLYDSVNVGTAKGSNNEDVKCFIFYCGSASDLV